MKKVLAYIIYLFALLLIIELAFRLIIFREDSTYQSTYEAVTQEGSTPPYVSQPYLNYINNPKFKDSQGNAEITKMGIRYPREVSLQKPDSTYRIVFLGGSTTFGDVEDTFDVYAALVEKALKPQIKELNAQYNDIECLNCGVHGLTSAELLTHYLFKYQYLQPDLVVLHTGFNDAFSYSGINQSAYQPDYHNMRRVFKDVPDLTPTERMLMNSKAIAYFIINHKYGDYLLTTLESNVFFNFNNDKIWFNAGSDSMFVARYNAFYNNITNLVRTVKAQGHQVLLTPEVCDSTKMPPNLKAVLPNGLLKDRAFLEQIAAENNVPFCNIEQAAFTPEFFLPDDGIHVNSAGEQIKAQYIRGSVAAIISGRSDTMQSKTVR